MTDPRESLRRQGEFIYTYLNQGEIWFPKDRPRIAIADMNDGWRHNAARWMLRRAATWALLYDFGETLVLATPSVRDVINEADDGLRAYGSVLSTFDLMSEHAYDAFEQAADERQRDPQTWIRTTKLYRALMADFVGGGQS